MKTTLLITLALLFQVSNDIGEIKRTVEIIDQNSIDIKPEYCYDLNLYKDTNPEKFLHQSTWLTDPAVINMTKYNLINSNKISLEIQGSITDLYSNYYFTDSSLVFIRIKRIDYDNPKWDKYFDSTKNEIIELEIAYNEGKVFWSNDSTFSQDSDVRVNQFIEDAKLLLEFKN